MRGSASTSASSVDSSKRCCAAKSRTVSGSLLTPRTKRRRWLLPCTALTMFLPHHPRPTMAASIILVCSLPAPADFLDDDGIVLRAFAVAPAAFQYLVMQLGQRQALARLFGQIE